MGLGEQRKEIATIRERNLAVKLSDADCRRIAEKAGRVGMTVEGLIASFIGDLVDGTYTNGSDERMYAQAWFDRCGFEMMAERTLLSWLIISDGVEWFMRDYEFKLSYEEELECVMNVESPTEEDLLMAEDLRDEIANCEDELRSAYDESGSDETYEDAVEKVVAWARRLEDM